MTAASNRPQQRVRPRDHGAHPPLSLAQRRVWFYDMLAPDAPFHCVPRVLAVKGPLDTGLLERAFNRMAERHDLLRSVYEEVDGEPQQSILPGQHLAVTVTDLTPGGAGPGPADLDALIRDDIATAFDITTGPVIRLSAYQLAANDWRLVLNFHHITCDGWSEGIALNELTALYEAYAAGQPDPLPPPRLQYADYAAYQQEVLGSPEAAGHHDYWRTQLGDQIPILDLPTDFPRPATETYEGDSIGLEFPPELVEQLQQLARANGVTLFMVAIAAYATLLLRYTGQEDIVLGTPVNNRELSDIHDVIGYFVTNLPLRLDLSGDPSFTELLARVRETVLGAFEHKLTTALPWPYPRDDLTVTESSHYRLIFFFQENPVGAVRRFAGLELTNANIHSPDDIALMGIRSPTVSVQQDLGFFIEPVGDRLFGWIEYSSALFTRRRILRMRDQYLTLLNSVVADSGETLSRLPILRGTEREQLVAPLDEAGQSLLTADHGALLTHQLWERSAERTPEAVAVASDETALSFNDIRERANAVAHELRDHGVADGEVVAVALPRSPELIIAVLGVLKAGAACAPVDPSVPPDALTRQLAHLGVRVVIAEDDEPLAGYDVVGVGDAMRPDAPGCTARPSGLAFVFSTSGSTGEARAVRISHLAAASGQLPALAAFPLCQDDRLLMMTSPGSVRLIGEIFWPGAAGARVVLPRRYEVVGPAELSELVNRHQVTVLASVPSALSALVEGLEPGDCASLRLVLALGEPLPKSLGSLIRQALPAARLVNSYAQTEASPALFWEYDASGQLFAPIGRPGAVSTAYLLDRHLQPVPVGVDGDIYIGGLTVADGYHRDDTATRERFLADPYAGFPGARMFKTGDVGRLLAPGLFEFAGRTDDRIKVRGHSVEPGAVEARLTAMDEIREAAVIAWPESGLAESLAAFVVASDGAVVPGDVVRARLTAILPQYMVPGTIHAVNRLPRSATGKIDRHALRAMQARAESPAAAVSELGQLVQGIWQEVFGGPVGPHESFYDLGGNSLQGIRIVSRTSRALRRKLPVRTLFEGYTITGMTALIEELDQAGR
jgi:amino acid adenylation domain-containing protein